jgi:orfB (fragment)
MLHSDQGSQYTPKEFTEYCEGLGITQSMSKTGYPYDNAPMERKGTSIR